MEPYETLLERAGKQASEKAKISDEEQNKINCRQALKSYLDKMFADERLEKLVFNERDDIELYKAEDVAIDVKGTKATIVYGLNGVGAYRKIEGVDLFHSRFYYLWGHHNSAFAMAYALMSDSNAKLRTEKLEDVIVSYLQKKVPVSATE